MKLEASIKASLEAVSKFTTSLESDLQWLSLETRTGIVLAVQELLVNIVEHAYAGSDGKIDFKLEQNETLITVIVTDHVQTTFAMPDSIKDPDPFVLSERGLGLFIITQIFDEVNYMPVSDGNQWKLTKTIEA
jgi:anti-sigma regulatory factor (Ser/Thr protein kinase)